MRVSVLTAFAAILLPAWLGAQSYTIQPDAVPCLPLEQNGALTATITPELTVDADQPPPRIYFRRMNLQVEDWYYVEMRYDENLKKWWGVFPKPEDAIFDRRDLRAVSDGTTVPANAWAAWWRAKDNSVDRDPNKDLDAEVIRERASLGRLERRNWLQTQGDGSLQKWFELRRYEPTEYFVAILDEEKRVVSRTPVAATSVERNCSVALTREQQEVANDLIVGETSRWQRNEEVFHWLCDGIDGRIDPEGERRADRLCGVVVWWMQPGVLVPAIAGTQVLTYVTIVNETPESSPTRPSGQ